MSFGVCTNDFDESLKYEKGARRVQERQPFCSRPDCPGRSVRLAIFHLADDGGVDENYVFRAKNVELKR